MKLLNSWVEGTALHNIAFKTIMIMPNLLLQKPSTNHKANIISFNSFIKNAELAKRRSYGTHA